MKLIIDIDEDDYEIMKYNIAVNNPLCPLSQEEMVFKVANGTPLEDIKAEIEVEREKNTNGEYDKIFELCLLTINKHIGVNRRCQKK